ncbi:hypothetical protein MMC29_003015 [Sticta canariensis]|nr:hypothetical protein [Sticta canariensis]
MAENDPNDGWKVVTPKRRKPSLAKSGQAQASRMSSETGAKASASSTPGFKSPSSAESTSKGRSTGSKAKSKRRAKSSHSKAKGEGTGISELPPTAESAPSTQGVSLVSPEKILQPAIEMPDLPQDILATASRGHDSPTRSHSSGESASYVTAQQSPATERSSSSSESYDSTDEGDVFSAPSFDMLNQSLWTPTQQRESTSGVLKASLFINASSNPEVSPTAQPSKTEDYRITPITLWTGTQDSGPKHHVIGQVQVSTDKTEKQEPTLIEENRIESRTHPSTDNATASNKKEDKSIAKLEEVSPESSLENIVLHSRAEPTVLPPATSSGSFSSICTVVSDVSDDPHQRVETYQSGHVPETSPIPSLREETLVEEDASLMIEGTPEVIINDDAESLGQKNTTQAKPQLSLTPEASTIHEDLIPSSSIHQELGLLPSQSTPTPSMPTQHEIPTHTLIATPQEFASIRADTTASTVDTTTSKMSSNSEQTENGSTSIQPEKAGNETTPKPKFTQLASIPEQVPSPPTLSPTREESSEFAKFRSANIPVESPSLSRLETLTREQAAAVVPRLNPNEQALTGLDVLAAASSPSSSRTRTLMSAETQFAQPPPRASGQPRRSHAIPIRAPLPAPGFARSPPVVEAYDHELRGIPSHYIPMQGAMHGMFFDPATNMFVGDGPPRVTPERADGTLPGTRRVHVAAEPISNRPVNPDNALHVQTEGQIASVNAAGARAAAAPSLRRPVGVAPTSAPTRAFQRYFCRCTGQWLDRPHDCPEAPPAALPSGTPIMPGTVLGPEWMTRRLDIDLSIYPGGLVPAPGSAAAQETSAVGGGAGDIPAHWLRPVPPGTAVGGEPAAVGWTSAVVGDAGGAGGGPAEGVAKTKKKKKKRSAGRRKKKGGATAAKEEGEGKENEEGGREEGVAEAGSGEGMAAAYIV